jgi:NAD(P)-dependent dehydrogenase (short-subunit alcohol dehydrogenase family)
MSLEMWRRVLAVNLDGVFLGTRYGIAAMQPRGGGSIVNVASVSGIRPFAGAAAYGAGKAAVRLLSKIAALECQNANNGVRVNVVSPGAVKTPMWQEMDFFRALVAEHGGTEQAFAAMAGAVPSQQFFSAEEVARTILYLASDESSHLSGIEVTMDRGNTG